MRRRVVVSALGLCGLPASLVAGPFENPIDVPARPSALAARSPMMAIARAGDRLVAAGVRGHIVFSDDDGDTWQQARVPVSTDLVALSFPTARAGWAVGHWGVILRTSDAGATWVKQLAGRQASNLAVTHYLRLAQRGPDADRALKQAQAQAGDAVQPFLDVHFETATRGIAVGTFNRVFETDDAGETWAPLFDAISNEDELHFYAVRSRAGAVFLAGEQGRVWRRRAGESRFTPVSTSYKGTLFALLAVHGGVLMALGMRGALFRSEDDGDTWQRVEVKVASGLTAAAALPQGMLAVTTQAGTLLGSSDNGKSFTALPTTDPNPHWGIAPCRRKRVALVGPTGVSTSPIT